MPGRLGLCVAVVQENRLPAQETGTASLPLRIVGKVSLVNQRLHPARGTRHGGATSARVEIVPEHGARVTLGSEGTSGEREATPVCKAARCAFDCRTAAATRRSWKFSVVDGAARIGKN